MYVGYRALYVCCVSHLWIDTSMMYGVVHSFVYLFSSYTSRFSCMMMIRCYAMSFSMWRAYTLGVWLAQRYLNMLSLLSLLSSPLFFILLNSFFFLFSRFLFAHISCVVFVTWILLHQHIFLHNNYFACKDSFINSEFAWHEHATHTHARNTARAHSILHIL